MKSGLKWWEKAWHGVGRCVKPVRVGAGEADKGLECLRLVNLIPGKGCGARHQPRLRPTAYCAGHQGHVRGWIPGYVQER